MSSGESGVGSGEDGGVSAGGRVFELPYTMRRNKSLHPDLSHQSGDAVHTQQHQHIKAPQESYELPSQSP